MRKRPNSVATVTKPPTVASFDLAPLQKYKPDEIVAESGKDQLGAFVLALAGAFNDLKGLQLLRGMVVPYRPKNANEISPQMGQYSGIDLQIGRLILAQLHELLALISEFHELASGVEVAAMLSTATPSTRREWAELLSLATGKGTTRDAQLAKVLMRVRNNAAYHYYEPQALVKGYRTHFFSSPKTARNIVAYASYGVNMEQTRFYYADAAYQALLDEIAGTMGLDQFKRRLAKMTSAVNQTLSHIVTTYIKTAMI